MTNPAPDLVDTHCHLNHDQLLDDIPEIIGRAHEAGVNRMIVVGFDVASSELAVSLAESHPGVFAAVAVHPHDSRLYDAAAADTIERLASSTRVVAIGEIGLDYHYDFSPREAQFAAFRSQLDLARRTELPVIIHCREAYADVLSILEEIAANHLAIDMHCWAGSVAESERAAALGCYFGFGGLITFRSAEEVREAARLAPTDRLLIETDAPYLAPAPHRGKRNEPAYSALAAYKLAELRAWSFEEAATVTTANAERAFPRITSW